MANKPFTATKRYEKSCFILTDRKFSRVVEVAKERLERVKGTHDLHERYEVGFLDKKEIRLDCMENVLGLDNSNKNPIVSILASFELKADEKVVYGVKIGFDGDTGYRGPIFVSGVSPELPWLQETLGAVEEQLDRTIPSDIAYSVNRRSLNFVFIVVLMVMSLAMSVLGTSSRTTRLSQEKLTEMINISESAKTDSEKLDFLFRYTAASIEKSPPSEKINNFLRDGRTYLIGVPLAVSVISAIVAIFWFYPRNVFSWGDCGESYDKTIERRKFLWYGVVLSLIIGVLGNLFVVGVTT